MLSIEFATITTLACYLIAGFFGLPGLIFNKEKFKLIAYWLVILGFVFQTVFLLRGLHGIAMTLGSYLQILAWFIILIALFLSWRSAQKTFLLMVAPLALLLFIASTPNLATAIAIPEHLNASFYALHIGALFVGLSFIAIAGLSGILFIILEKRLKAKQKLPKWLQDMPAINLLDKINKWTIILAFPLYTLGLMTGFFWAKSVFKTPFGTDPKEIMSIFIWILLAITFHTRLLKDWYGRKPAWLSIVICALSVISILIINNFMQTHHSFR